MARYGSKDASKDTGVTRGEVKRAWHNARNDYQKSGGKLGNRSPKGNVKNGK